MFCTVLCTPVVHSDMHAFVGLGLLSGLVFVCFLSACCVPVLFAFVVLGLVSSVPSQHIVLQERLQNVKWDIKH